VKRPLFWVVLVQSASSLAQQQMCGEYLVVGADDLNQHASWVSDRCYAKFREFGFHALR
jgi:hypothetical protein